jgi:hypothetical protein
VVLPVPLGEATLGGCEMHPTAHRDTAHSDTEAALDDVAVAQAGLVEQLAATRTAQKRLFAELIALRGRYLQAHRAYCAAYAAIRNHGVRERVLTDLDCPPLDPRFDPFLRDAFVGRGKPT